MGGECCAREQKTSEKTIVFVGPRKSGKTSIIYYLKNKQMKKQYEETKQTEQFSFEFQQKKYELKDFPSYNDQIKADAWVYVIDINNPKEVNDLNEFLKKQDGKTPVLLLKNKNDLSGQTQQVDDSKIQWGQVGNHEIFKTSNNGDKIEMGFEWLHQKLSKE